MEKQHLTIQTKHPYLKIWKAEDNLWHWHTTAENGNILDKSSEGYSSKQNVVEGYIDSTRAHLRSCGMGWGTILYYLKQLKKNLATFSHNGPKGGEEGGIGSHFIYPLS